MDLIDSSDTDGNIIDERKNNFQNISAEKDFKDAKKNGCNFDFVDISHNDRIENNLITQLLMIPNCFGDYIVYKTKTVLDQDIVPCPISRTSSSSSPSSSSSSSSSSQSAISESHSIPSDETNKTEKIEFNSTIKSKFINSTEKLNETINNKSKITRREIWEMIEYRYLCSLEGVVTDRIHRINMQRKEGLLALKETKFTDI